MSFYAICLYKKGHMQKIYVSYITIHKVCWLETGPYYGSQHAIWVSMPLYQAQTNMKMRENWRGKEREGGGRLVEILIVATRGPLRPSRLRGPPWVRLGREIERGGRKRKRGRERRRGGHWRAARWLLWPLDSGKPPLETMGLK